MNVLETISSIIDAPLQQIASVLLVALITLFFFVGFDHSPSSLAWFAHMVFENMGLSMLFRWGGGSSEGSLNSPGSPTSAETKKLKKKLIRSRAELKDAGSSDSDNRYPGLVNISGTYCFLNSTLQAMASLTYLQPHIEAIHEKAEDLDVPTPVIDALREELIALNSPSSHPTPLRPIQIIEALSTPTPGFKRGTLFSSREHQDAQELFQLISETVKEEALAVDKEGMRDPGLGGLGELSASAVLTREPGKGVFEGLTANRRSCVECGYTEAVMHFGFDNLQLSVPRLASVALEDCLADFTRLEMLNDCICRKCSLLATHRKLVAEVEKQSAPSEGGETASKKKRIREAKKLEARVQTALKEGRIEDDLKGVKIEKVFSRCSTKQAMIGRPPPVLALHINRSTYMGHYAGKNPCHVIFPEILDLTPFTTSGQLSTQPSAPISNPPPTPHPRSTTPTPRTYATPRTLYRLAAVVCHYGAHSFGHYVAYRRKPRPPSAGASRWTPPTMRCPFGCACEKCTVYGHVREEVPNKQSMFRTGGWLRISDDSVSEVSIETVLRETSGTFMLYYERIVPYSPPLEPIMKQISPRSSEETVRPKPEFVRQPSEARVVRSVFAGRKGKEKEKTPGVGNGIANGYANGHAKPLNGSAMASDDSLASLPLETKPRVVDSSSPSPALISNSTHPLPPSHLETKHQRSTLHHIPIPDPISPVRTVDLKA